MGESDWLSTGRSDICRVLHSAVLDVEKRQARHIAGEYSADSVLATVGLHIRDYHGTRRSVTAYLHDWYHWLVTRMNCGQFAGLIEMLLGLMLDWDQSSVKNLRPCAF